MATLEKKLLEENDFETPYSIGFTVKGIKTFFFNRFDVNGFEASMDAPPGSKKNKFKNRDMETLVWRADDGMLAVEGKDFQKALSAAGRYFKDPSGTGRRSVKPMTEEALTAEEELCSFGVKTWDAIDVRPARLRNGATVPVYRPILKAGWELQVTIDVALPDHLRPGDIAGLMNLAGRIHGVGDNRKYGFGRFVVTNVEAPQDLTWID